MSGFVYLMQQGVDGPYKIGFTQNNPVRRIKQLQTGNPEKIRLVSQFAASVAVEAYLHGKFSDLRLQGEWFKPDSAILGIFDFATQIPSSPETLPPVTAAGRELFRLIEGLGLSETYPDGSKHSETDWDELALICIRMDADFNEWRAANV